MSNIFILSSINCLLQMKSSSPSACSSVSGDSPTVWMQTDAQALILKETGGSFKPFQREAELIGLFDNQQSSEVDSYTVIC